MPAVFHRPLVVGFTLIIACLQGCNQADVNVFFSQELAAVSSSTYSDNWSHWRDLDYNPYGLNAIGNDEGARDTLYSGLWSKNPNVVAWQSWRNQTYSEYLAKWDELVAQNYRVLDLDAHVSGDIPYYHAIFIKEDTQPLFRSHSRLTAAQLVTRLADYKADGYRPIKLNGYTFGGVLYYAAVWVEDSISEYRVERDLTSFQYSVLWNVHVNDGYIPLDIAAYPVNGNLRYAGIWIKDAYIKNFVSLRDMNASQLDSNRFDLKKKNYVMVDLDSYVTDGGDLRHSAVWHRKQAYNIVRSNADKSGSNFTNLVDAAEEYVEPGVDGRSGSLGFYVEDLTNGNFVSFNGKEPTYLASTAKVFIAAKIIDMPEVQINHLYTLQNSDWRGEDDRGFALTDIGSQFTIDTYLSNMIRRSDTASTDKLFGLADSFDGTRSVYEYASNNANLFHIGEITSICDVDKGHVQQSDSCILDVSCHVFERWWRGGETTQADQDDLDCFADVNAAGLSRDERYDPYYHTLANSITPLEYGNFWRQVADHSLLDATEEGDLVRILDGTGSNYNLYQGTLYDDWGGKHGGKHKARSWVAIAWDWGGATVDYSSLDYQYSISIFTEEWSEDSDDADQDSIDIITDVVRYAIPFLDSRR